MQNDETEANKEEASHDPITGQEPAQSFSEESAEDYRQAQEVAAIETNAGSAPVADSVASPSESVSAGNYLAPPKSHKGLIISLVAVFVLLVAAAGGFAYWYFAVRTADVEYEKATAIVDAMLTGASGIESARDSLEQAPSPSTDVRTTSTVKLAANTSSQVAAVLKKLQVAKEKSAEYLLNQQSLKEATVVQKDSSIRAVYDTNKKVIDRYGESADAFYKTGFVYVTMLDRCFASGALLDFSEVRTIADYDRQAKECKDYLGEHTTVAAKEFDTEVYQQVREGILSLITYTRTLLTAAPTSSEFKQAQQNLTKLGDRMNKLDTTVQDRIQPSQNPKDQLKALKDKITERKEQFFR